MAENVMPISKYGGRENASNYRPVFLTTNIRTTSEEIIRKQIKI